MATPGVTEALEPVPDAVEPGLQSLLFSGFGWLPHCELVGLRFASGEALRRWLGRVRPQVNFGPIRREQPLHRAFQVALTAAGLGLVDPDAVAELGPVFAGGMTAPASRARLGDDTFDPSWRWSDRTVHALVLAYGRSAEDVGAFARELTSGEQVTLRRAAHQPAHDREPFGFRDGVSALRLPRRVPATGAVPAGELVLGLPGAEEPAAELRGVGRYGSFVVVRELDQDVEGFWRTYLERAGGDEVRAVWLAAKAVGRWPNGMPVLDGQREEPPAEERGVHGLSFLDDRDGAGCPFGSHVRRANPRETLVGDPATSLRVVRQHLLMRRGRVYGGPARASAYPSALRRTMAERGATPSEDGAHGLLFVALCADLRRQFEFVQQNWLLGRKFADLYDERDAVLAKATALSVPTGSFARVVEGLGGWVTPRAGGYAVLLHADGLGALVSG